MDYELRKLQEKSLEILLVFKEFCEKHDLLFYFCGGCCIGTLRHQGFIPWDDDIDVFMPRDDYEKLGPLWEEEMAETKYRFCRDSEDMFLRSLLSSISDEETTFIKERQQFLTIISCRLCSAASILSRWELSGLRQKNIPMFA